METNRQQPAKPLSAETGWRVGVLFSRTGVTAATESEHVFGTVLAIEESQRGRRRGRSSARPSSCMIRKAIPTNIAGLASRMLQEDEVTVIFGCSTSSSRKAVCRSSNAITRCSGIARSTKDSNTRLNVIYTGAVPNQNSMQAGGLPVAQSWPAFFLVGADYIYPRESNRIMRDMVEQHGGEIVEEVYLPSDANPAALQDVIEQIRANRARRGIFDPDWPGRACVLQALSRARNRSRTASRLQA